MHPAQQKIVQFLSEAHATEQALTRDLQSQIAMTPHGSYRSALETHLDETRDHASRVRARSKALGQGSNPLTTILGAAESVIAQAVTLGKAPLNLVRGSGGEEKLLKNAKDACAAEMFEIATYEALEHLARSAGDDETARLAASIRADEEKMYKRVLSEFPKLTEAVVRADVYGDDAFDAIATGAADRVRDADKGTRDESRSSYKAPKTAHRGRTSRATKPGERREGTARRTGKKPAAARVGAARSDDDLAIRRYDTLTAEQIVGRLGPLSPGDLAKIETHEREHKKRKTILERIASLRREQPTVAAAGPRAVEHDSDGHDDRRTAASRGADKPGDVVGSDPPAATALGSSEAGTGTAAGRDRPAAAANGSSMRGPVGATGGELEAAAADGAHETDAVTGPGDDLRAAADAGDRSAALELWERLRDTDRASAERYLRNAADSGDVHAALRLGMLLWERRDLDAAEEMLRSATNDTQGAHALGLLLWRERGNPGAAVEWLDRAAQADDPAAERDLGILLRENGDVQGAQHWLSRAADRDGEARHALAELVASR